MTLEDEDDVGDRVVALQRDLQEHRLRQKWERQKLLIKVILAVPVLALALLYAHALLYAVVAVAVVVIGAVALYYLGVLLYRLLARLRDWWADRGRDRTKDVAEETAGRLRERSETEVERVREVAVDELERRRDQG